MSGSDEVDHALSPVGGGVSDDVEEGVALCLSGGGYRAMLFHAGAIRRLNELGYLAKLRRVSSVSGGSITAAVMGAAWLQLRFDDAGVADDLDALVVAPVRRLAATSLDVGAVVRGVLGHGTVADQVAQAYREHLFGTATLQDLPDEPRFVINATNLQTGVLWRFSKLYMADYTVGVIPRPSVELAVAVAASSAFPPVLSPLRMTVDPESFAAEGRGPLHHPPFTTDVVLSDGGVYDNLGLETAWKRLRTVLVSDGGGRMPPEGTIDADWVRQSVRVNAVIDNQVRDLRKRLAVTGFRRGDRKGTYWGIRSAVEKYGPPAGALICPSDLTVRLAEIPTRLKALDGTVQERLINWGYAVTDVAMRRWMEPDAQAPIGFSYPDAGLG